MGSVTLILSTYYSSVIYPMCPLSDAEIVFVKDCAYFLANRLDDLQHLPQKYIHTFLMRDPKKTVPSLHRVSNMKDLIGINSISLHKLYR